MNRVPPVFLDGKVVGHQLSEYRNLQLDTQMHSMMLSMQGVQQYVNDTLAHQPIHDQQRAFSQSSKFKQNLKEWDEWLEEKRGVSKNV